MSIQTIRTAIKTKLDTLKGSGKPFANVYDYLTTKPSWFPCVMFEPSDLASAFNSTCENERTYTFDAYILQEMTEQTREESVDIVMTAFDDLINALDKDYTLSWAVKKVNAVPWNFGTAEHDHGSVYYANIQIVCTVLYNIAT